MADGFGISVEELTQLSLARDPPALHAAGGVQALASKLKVDFDHGVNEDDVARRSEVFGRNVYPEPPPKTFLGLLWEAAQDTTIQILTALAVISLVLALSLGEESGWYEPVAIMVAVVIVANVGALNNWSKERQFRNLNKVKENRPVKVLRGGKRLVISIHDIVVGDVCVIESGDQVPADGVMIDGFNLATDESAMTGEPYGVKKTADEPFMLSGTQVAEGTGRMLILGVGINSEWGQTIEKLTQPAEDTPLQEKLDNMANQIGKGGLAVAVAVFIVLSISYTIRRSTGSGWDSSAANSFVHFFLVAVTIVVVAVPEGLPLAVTIALAYSMKKMMKDNNLVRHLSACETMGGATTICSDKTGTLTENRMTVVQGYFSGEFFEDVPKKMPNERAQQFMSEGISINSKAVVALKEDGRPDFVGNKTECAMLWMLQKDFGFDWEASRKTNTPRIRQIYTFSSDRKRMGTILKNQDGNFRLYVNGASEIVSALCTHRMALTGDRVPITEAERTEIDNMIVRMASSGLRTICISYRDLGNTDGGAAWDDLQNTPELDLTLIAIVGIKDPLRKEVYDAVARCKQSGILVRMVTGDNILTAQHIARECGILHDDGIAIEGRVFRVMSDEEKDRVIPRLQVMARSTPSDKYLLVSRLRALGEVVAVTGDGTNDAPALKEADVGLSMGLSGTEVAKEASDIVILDDNFSSIVKAVLWGRSVYENIRKFLQFQLTVNIVALTVVFVGAIAQRDLPLTAVQLLWINLIMDTFAALALATEPPSPELLERKPYGRYDPLITSVMMRNIIAQAIWQIAVVLTIMFAGPGIMGIAEDSVVITSMSFNSFVWCQMFNEFNARRIGDNDGPFTNIFGNLTPMKSPLFFAIWVGTAGVQAILIEFGGSAVQTTGLTAAQWWVCIALGVGSLPIGVISRCIPVPTRKASIPKDVLEMRERALRGEPKTEEMKELVASDSKDGESSSARKSDETAAGGESSPRHHNSQPKVKTVARTQSDIVEAAPMLESEDKKEEEAADRS